MPEVDANIPMDVNARNVAAVWGYDPVSKKFHPLAVKDNGDGTYTLKIDAVIETGDIEIGAVEIKSYDSDDRAHITDNSLDVNVTALPEITVTIDRETSSVLAYGQFGDNLLALQVNGDGKLLVMADDSPMTMQNMTAEYAYTGTGKISTIKEYPTGAIGGAPAKLSTYTYNIDDKVEKIAVTDTTV